ncbi:MAG: leucine-rich repeat domain-containing protein [Bacillota bacterium]
MKKTPFVLLALLLALGLAACGAPASTGTPSPEVSESIPVETPEPTEEPTTEPVVVFTDAALEAKVREAMSKPDGDITVAEAEAVVKLDLSNESFDDMNSQNGGIRDISDLKYFTGLEDLNLSFNDISDLAPLAELKSIKSLGFTGVRPKDLSVLKGLTNLVFLGFDWTCDEDERQNGTLSLDFMSDMKDLEIFSCMGNGVQDISALGGLTKIWSLFLDDNAITDISVLANLTNLKELKLSKNPIEDYSPLKDIYPKLEFSDFEMN